MSFKNIKVTKNVFAKALKPAFRKGYIEEDHTQVIEEDQDYKTYPQHMKDFQTKKEATKRKMYSLDLFSGIGGFSLACEWAHIETAGFCDNNKYTRKVMKRHFKDALDFDDVKTLTKENFDKKWKEEKDDKVPQIQLITAGFPCQPFSDLGSRKGLQDSRNLFGQAIRIANDFKCPWLLFENVARFYEVGFSQMRLEMEGAGYQTEAFLVPASAVNALHQRKRAIIVGFNERYLLSHPLSDGWTAFDTRYQGGLKVDTRGFNGRPLDKPGVCRTIDGLQERMDRPALDGLKTKKVGTKKPKISVDKLTLDRLKACGNSIVPQAFYPFVKYIKYVTDAIVEDQEKTEPIKYNAKKIVSKFISVPQNVAALKEYFIRCEGVNYFKYKCDGLSGECRTNKDKSNVDIIETKKKEIRPCNWNERFETCWINFNNLDDFRCGKKMEEFFQQGPYEDNKYLYDNIYEEIMKQKINLITFKNNKEEYLSFAKTLQSQRNQLGCHVYYL